MAQSYAALAPHLRPGRAPGSTTVDFSDTTAVALLNSALMAVDYEVDGFEIPDGSIAPGIPGRADYIHLLADLLADDCSSGGEAEDHSHLPATPVMEVDASASETNVAERVQKKRTKRPAATGKKTRHGQRARKGHMKLPSTDVDELDGSGILEDPPPLQLELQPEGLAEGVEDAWERGPVADARPLL